MINFLFSFFINYFIFNSSFPFISDICDEIIEHDDDETLEELFNHDSSISEMMDEYNWTLLHDAAYCNNTSCVRVLLRFAPHLVDAVNKKNYTPLMLAVGWDRRDVAKMLVRAGTDVRKKNNHDRTMSMYARMNNNNKEMLEILKQHQQV